jgi:phosphohistidine phosphatase
MIRTLALLRHGLAAGQGQDAALLPEGAEQLRRLADRLEQEGWRPVLVVTSPYRRARESALVVASVLQVATSLQVLPDLVPEGEPGEALEAVQAAGPLATPVLVVTHLPLVGRLAEHLVGEDPGFGPGTFVEIAHEANGDSRLLRRIAARDLSGR